MTPPTADTLARYALAAAARGWHVFPLRPGDKRPAVTNWEGRATATDTARIRRCWQHAPYNIGIACGPSGLVVIDLDTPKPGQVPPPEWADEPGISTGADVLAALAERHGQPFPFETYTVRTASGGMHLYFTAPAGARLRNTAGRLGWLIDTRAHGGYVVAAGSAVGPNAYATAYDVPPAPLPGWLAELLHPAPRPTRQPVVVHLAAPGRRAAYLNKAIKASVDAVAAAPQGRRNATLYGAAVALGQLVAGGALDPADTEDLLVNAAVQSGQSELAARRTIVSGFRAGAQRPRRVPA
ncbi:hypothetical protein Acsp04_58900 [Actinomadura sp. NBRC 104425]|uniref:bifunctional DNA primase/polymerase n=1 Tax=Actinomadura sp. NBRC 104425 TaxID=3032204 RepID=UPI0024A1CB61|nr:bifunctional DNA primase/polymerase [Actinomadura sp. NBRC 104425]GLZ15655.1 hypothetical protein Acsp04_58900 [Actinomadura sp. NBRC 104425]